MYDVVCVVEYITMLYLLKTVMSMRTLTLASAKRLVVAFISHLQRIRYGLCCSLRNVGL